jgi:hypothetical protein
MKSMDGGRYGMPPLTVSQLNGVTETMLLWPLYNRAALTRCWRTHWRSASPMPLLTITPAPLASLKRVRLSAPDYLIKFCGPGSSIIRVGRWWHWGRARSAGWPLI